MELGLETVSSLLEENRGGCLDTKLGGVLRAGLAFDHSCGRSPCPSAYSDRETRFIILEEKDKDRDEMSC